MTLQLVQLFFEGQGYDCSTQTEHSYLSEKELNMHEVQLVIFDSQLAQTFQMLSATQLSLHDPHCVLLSAQHYLQFGSLQGIAVKLIFQVCEASKLIQHFKAESKHTKNVSFPSHLKLIFDSCFQIILKIFCKIRFIDNQKPIIKVNLIPLQSNGQSTQCQNQSSNPYNQFKHQSSSSHCQINMKQEPSENYQGNLNLDAKITNPESRKAKCSEMPIERKSINGNPIRSKTLFDKAYEIDKRHFYLKYIALFIMFIIYGTIVSLVSQESFSENIEIGSASEYQPFQSLEDIQSRLNSDNQKSIILAQKRESQTLKGNQEPKILEGKNVSRVFEQKKAEIFEKNQKLRVLEEKKLSRVQEKEKEESRILKEKQSPEEKESIISEEEKKEQIDKVQYQTSIVQGGQPKSIVSIEQPESRDTSQIHEMSVFKFKSEQCMFRQIIQTYTCRRQQIIQVEQQLANKNSHAIEELKRQVLRANDNFEQKLEHFVKSKQQSVLVNLKLFPFLQTWATTPKLSTALEKLAYRLFGNIFYGKTYFWDDLYDMLKYGGYWQSSGDLLTVATYSKVIDDKHGSLQIFTPTLITLEFPYDTPLNETVQFTGIRLRYDLHRRVETRWISQVLGQLKVSVTESERELGQPVKRFFYCEEEACNYLYSMIQLRTVNRVRLHSLKIDTSFTVGK